MNAEKTNQFNLDLTHDRTVITPREEKKQKPQKNLFVLYLGTAGQIGFSIVIPLLLGIGAGIWLDNRFQTRPVFVLIGLLVGFLLSIVNLIFTIRQILNINK